MGRQYVLVSSVTYAYKGRDALQNKGVTAFIEKAPQDLSSCGCHYCIYYRGCTPDRVARILEDARVRILSAGER